MHEKIETLQKRRTYKVVLVPMGTKIIGNRWEYKTKQLADYKIKRHKRQGVVQDLSHLLGVDFDE